MEWITRERPKIDRIACPWLILRFIDAEAQFHYVPSDQVMEIATARAMADDHQMLRQGLIVYDALYAWCAKLQHESHAWPPAGYSLAS